jgi:hypothetical protein
VSFMHGPTLAGFRAVQRETRGGSAFAAGMLTHLRAAVNCLTVFVRNSLIAWGRNINCSLQIFPKNKTIIGRYRLNVLTRNTECLGRAHRASPSGGFENPWTTWERVVNDRGFGYYLSIGSALGPLRPFPLKNP